MNDIIYINRFNNNKVIISSKINTNSQVTQTVKIITYIIILEKNGNESNKKAINTKQ
jgi:hypothetical protein